MGHQVRESPAVQWDLSVPAGRQSPGAPEARSVRWDQWVQWGLRVLWVPQSAGRAAGRAEDRDRGDRDRGDREADSREAKAGSRIGLH